MWHAVIALATTRSSLVSSPHPQAITVASWTESLSTLNSSPRDLGNTAERTTQGAPTLSRQAFMRLESLDTIQKPDQAAYGDLALQVFRDAAPEDPHVLREARDAGGAHADVAAKLKRPQEMLCVASGRVSSYSATPHIAKRVFMGCFCCFSG